MSSWKENTWKTHVEDSGPEIVPKDMHMEYKLYD